MAPLLSSARWVSPVATKHGALILLPHCFTTGLIDATIFGNYSVFVAMQTGNTIILALSTANLPHGQPYAWLVTLVSLGSFLVGALTTAQVSYRVGPLRRVTLTVNLLLQGVLIAVSAIIITVPDLIPTDPVGAHEGTVHSDAIVAAVIPCLAFQSGAQITTSKLMGVDEIPVNVITSLYAGLMSDKGLFVWRKNGISTWGWYSGDVKRTRRIAALMCSVGGALCAAWILRRGPGILLTLWLAAAIKIVVALIAGLFLPEEDTESEGDKVKEFAR